MDVGLCSVSDNASTRRIFRRISRTDAAPITQLVIGDATPGWTSYVPGSAGCGAVRRRPQPAWPPFGCPYRLTSRATSTAR